MAVTVPGAFRVLLDHLSSQDRASALRDIASGLSQTGDYAAAENLSDALQSYPDPDTTELLQKFLLDSIALGHAKAAALVCHNSPSILDVLLKRTASSLNAEAASLRANGSFITDDTFCPEYSGSSSDKFSGIVQCNLGFLLHVFRLSSEQRPLHINQNVARSIIPYLLAKDESSFRTSRDAMFALMGAIQRRTVIVEDDATGTPFHHEIWSSCIDSVFSITDENPHYSTALQIWLRWLSLPPNSGLCQRLFNSDQYWEILLHGFYDQHDFESLKAYLHIIRMSLAIAVEQDIEVQCSYMKLVGTKASKMKIQLAYERFLTIFETMIIGRYINQIRECERDLDHLASAGSLVGSSWLFILLMAALSSRMQDSIQKFAGNWLMRSNMQISQDHHRLQALVASYLLPWATQGPLYTNSVAGAMDDMYCEHGDLLASYIERTLKILTLDQPLGKHYVLSQIVSYLFHHRTNIMAHSVVYVLHGIARGLQPGHDSSVNEFHVSQLQALAAEPGYSEVIRDMVLLQTMDICKRSSAFSADYTCEHHDTGVMRSRFSTMQTRLEQLKKSSHLDFDTGHDQKIEHWPSLDAFVADLDSTRCACLQGAGLLAACKRLPSLLRDVIDVSPEIVLKILDAVWTETEIQDYQKAPLQLLPRTIWSPAVFHAALSNHTLMDFLHSVFLQYQQLIQGRIYLWSPLMRSLRDALILEPRLVEPMGVVDFVVSTANKPPSAKLEFQLDAAALKVLTKTYTEYKGLSYNHYYGEHASVGYAAFFDLIGHTDNLSRELTDQLYDHLLKPWKTQKLPPPVVIKWKTTEQLQIMLLLLEQRLTRNNAESAAQDLDIMLRLLSVEPLPRFRFLLEWMISRIVVRYPGLREGVVEGIFTRDHHSNPKYLASLTKLTATFACFDTSEEEFGVKVGSGLVALSASAKSINRHEAQWQFPILWDHAEARGWKTFTSNPGFRQLMEFIKSLDVYREAPLERRLERLDPVNDFTLTKLLSGSYLYLEPPGVVRVERDDLKSLEAGNTGSPWTKEGIISVGEELGPLPTRPALPTATQKSSLSGGLGALQTKGTAYLSSTRDEDNESRPSDLIVVGSLVDSAYNLGGLSRVSEIFGAAALYISNPTITLNHKDFISVAVASQNHIPIRALPLVDLPAWLTQKKNEGYCIVGIEQTDRSKILGAEGTVLPEKTILVLGAEKEGMPPLIMGECDVLVEIPQKGKTRSLNVQTAAAAVLYDYARQHRKA
ncbi:hypothetical protein MBLNU457_6174t1 [Dothideomycetes sp. NU457]